MTVFTAGRFKAQAFLGPQNGRVTHIVELLANGSDEKVGSLRVSYEELLDLKYVLDRAIAAHA